MNNALAVYDTGSSASWETTQATAVIIRKIPNIIILVLHGLNTPKQHLTPVLTSSQLNMWEHFILLSLAQLQSHTSLEMSIDKATISTVITRSHKTLKQPRSAQINHILLYDISNMICFCTRVFFMNSLQTQNANTSLFNTLLLNNVLINYKVCSIKWTNWI